MEGDEGARVMHGGKGGDYHARGAASAAVAAPSVAGGEGGAPAAGGAGGSSARTGSAGGAGAAVGRDWVAEPVALHRAVDNPLSTSLAAHQNAALASFADATGLPRDVAPEAGTWHACVCSLAALLSSVCASIEDCAPLFPCVHYDEDYDEVTVVFTASGSSLVEAKSVELRMDEAAELFVTASWLPGTCDSWEQSIWASADSDARTLLRGYLVVVHEETTRYGSVAQRQAHALHSALESRLGESLAGVTTAKVRKDAPRAAQERVDAAVCHLRESSVAAVRDEVMDEEVPKLAVDAFARIALACDASEVARLAACAAPGGTVEVFVAVVAANGGCGRQNTVTMTIDVSGVLWLPDWSAYALCDDSVSMAVAAIATYFREATDVVLPGVSLPSGLLAVFDSTAEAASRICGRLTRTIDKPL